MTCEFSLNIRCISLQNNVPKISISKRNSVCCKEHERCLPVFEFENNEKNLIFVTFVLDGNW